MTEPISGHQQTDEMPPRLAGQNRLRLIGMCFAAAFLTIAGQLAHLTIFPAQDDGPVRPLAESPLPRPDIVDRNGVLLATDVAVASIFADPSKIIDMDEAVEALTATMPDLDARELRRKLSASRRFAWIKRQVSPEERDAVYNLGIPGVSYVNERRRVYPQGRLAAHVAGYVDLDTRGIAGIEKYLDDRGALYTASLAEPTEHRTGPAQLSLDIRVQAAMIDELTKAIGKFHAIAGGGIVMDIGTGEVLAMVSLPDFNPNQENKNFSKDQQNRMTSGVYELGSVIKAVTFAMALDSGKVTLESRFDTRFPLVIGSARIHDFHPQNRLLTTEEVFCESSNIGTAKMALEVGLEEHQAFLRKVGLFDKLQTELPEAAGPLLPRRWSRLVTATTAFGHGFAVQPLQGAAVVAGLLNGGHLITPTFLRRNEEEALAMATTVIKPATSETLRYLFRQNALKGSAGKADVIGYRVGGKTGTAEKVVNGRYDKNQRLASFIGAFPMDDPRYLVMVMLDDPKAIPGTYGFATAGWNAVPAAASVIERIAPMLGVEPVFSEQDLQKLAKLEAKDKKTRGDAPD
ncbi:penicillin-binding protein 2 [Aestuariivirga sp.]|uniref:peptidoglycan D,D-transpeptidase FtsI family protein n=1 Tax=Aestuariivirga sp. TaxID=2650926 RepID=UPI0025BED62C|nr:penicillin-binding protein 2 [Aestuariivirga sp.]MCA3555583.1 penicillin-binding protein 2 [Aestuariivirga sp.]